MPINGKHNRYSYLKIGVLALVLMISTIPTMTADAQLTPDADTIVISQGTEPGAFDPQYTFGMNNLGMIRQVTETLVKIDQKTGEILPVLALSWTADSAAENWTITLRQGVKFHDGSDFTAKDVKYTIWDRIAAPDAKAFVHATFGYPSGPIKAVEIIDDYTVKIVTSGDAGLMGLFNYQPSEIVSKTKCDSFDSSDDTRQCEDFQDDPSGTGPYKFVKWEKGNYIQYVRNDDYWGKAPLFKNFIWKKITESSAKLAALLAGDVDYIHNILPTDIKIVETDPDVYIIEGPPLRMIHIGMAPCHDALANRQVRQALNYAVNQSKIVDTIYAGYGAAMDDSFLPHLAYGYQVSNITYPQDIAKAKSMLDAAGYTVNATTGERFEFTLIYGAGRYTADKQMVEAVQSFLDEVDVTMNIEAHEWASFSALSKLRNCTEIKPKYDAWWSGFGNLAINTQSAFRNYMSTGQNLEPILYNNSYYDSLYFKSVVETDETKLFALFEEMTDIAMTEAHWIYLTIQPNVHAAKRALNITTYHDETVDISGVYLAEADGAGAPGFMVPMVALALLLSVGLFRRPKKRK